MTGYLDHPPDDDGRLRLFCFHQAGAGASAFAGWDDALAPDISVHPVQLPGRENRVTEPRITDFAALASDAAAALAPWLTGPWAAYGHSMGAALAADVVRRRVRSGGEPPVALLVGAYPDPAGPPPLSVLDRSDEDVADLLVRIGGMSPLVRRYPEWSGAAVRLLRADLTALHNRNRIDPTALPVPIHAYAGTDDPLVDPDAVAGWARHTDSSFALTTVPGGHLFHLTNRPSLLAAIGTTLAAAAGDARFGRPAGVSSGTSAPAGATVSSA